MDAVAGTGRRYESKTIRGRKIDMSGGQALDTQIGGTHYKGFVIQPVEFIHKNKIGFCEGSSIKYLCRWRDKGGVADLEKAKHFIDLLIEMEKPEC